MSTGPSIRRILVAVDASPHSLAALAAAADLAAGLNADLEGVFVEDLDLLRCFQLPLVRARAQYAARPMAFSLEDITREMQARAAAAAAELAAVAVRRKLRWAFRTVRGAVPEALLAAAEDVDLITLGRASRTSGLGRRDIGSTARVVTARSAVNTLLVASGQRLRPPVALLHDGSSAAVQATRLAAQLTRQLHGRLYALVLGAGPDDDPGRVADVRRQLDAQGVVDGDVRPVGADRHGLAAALGQIRPGLVVAPRDVGLPDGDAPGAALDHCRCPVLLVR